MNKRIKFSSHLVPLIFSGDKTATWRLFDDKELTAGDIVDCYVSETGSYFGTVELTLVSEKPMGELTDEDWVGHERFDSDEAMHEANKAYYPGKEISSDTMLKIVHFKLLTD